MLVNYPSICKFNLRIIRRDFTLFQLPLGVRQIQKTILGMANNFNLGTKTHYLQYRVNANLANKKEKRKKKRQRKKNQTAGYTQKLKIKSEHTTSN